jgi:hypothetical protein
MRSQPREQSASAWRGEVPHCEVTSRLECRKRETGHQEWVTRNAQHWTEGTLGELFPPVDDGLHETTPGFRVRTEFPILIGEIVLQHHRSAVVQRMSKWSITVDPLQAILC